jgi:hypothetical protein
MVHTELHADSLFIHLTPGTRSARKANQGLVGNTVSGLAGCDDDILGSSAIEAEEPFSCAVELTTQIRLLQDSTA